MSDDEQIAALAEREPTSDPSEIYDDLDVLPVWWREVVEEFDSNDLRPYRPSRFTDGEIVRETVDALEERYDVEISISAKNPAHDGLWTVYVDGEAVGEVEHRRKPDGYTEYGVPSEQFEEMVAGVTIPDSRESVADGSE